jgi:hypothetical protein
LDLSAPASAAKIGIIIAITAVVGPTIEAIGSAVDQKSYQRPRRRILTQGVRFGREGRRGQSGDPFALRGRPACRSEDVQRVAVRHIISSSALWTSMRKKMSAIAGVTPLLPG